MSADPARPAKNAAAGRVASGPPPAVPPQAAAPQPFLPSRARALALSILARLEPPVHRPEPVSVSAPLLVRPSAEASRLGQSSATFRQRRLEALASLLLAGGIDDAEASVMVGDVESRIFPTGARADEREASGGSDGNPAADGRDPSDGLERDAADFERGLSALGGFGGGGGGEGRRGAAGTPAEADGIVIPFAFSAMAGGGHGKNIEFRGFLRVQYPTGVFHAPRLEAHLEAGPSRWSFSLDGSSWRLDREGGMPPSSGAELAALAARLGELGFAHASTEGSASNGDEGAGLWA